MNQRLVFIFIGFLVLINIGLLLTSLNNKNTTKSLSKDLKVTPTNVNTANNNSNKEYISAISNIDNISASLKADDLKLKMMLKELGVFEPNSVALYTDKGLQTKLISVNEIVIHLTDKEQSLGQITSEVENKIVVYQSFSMKYDSASKKVDLYLHLQKGLIEKEDAAGLSRRFSYMLRYALWDLTHPLKDQNGGIEEITKGKDEFMEKNLLTEWFNIEK